MNNSQLPTKLRGIGYTILFVGVFSVGCSRVEFSDVPQTAQVSPTVDKTDNSNLEKDQNGGGNNQDDQSSIEKPVVVAKTESFATFAGNGNLDLIWMIDSSGSMNQEAEHVRNNFEQFASYVSERANLRMALIAVAEDRHRNGVDIPQNIIRDTLHLDTFVGSFNSLNILSGYMDWSHQETLIAATRKQMTKEESEDLLNFLRPNTQKGLIIVTDDESELNANKFVKIYNDIFPKSKLTVFGFVGHGKDISPCQANTGTQYIKLAKASGGKTFNICDENWDKHFDELAIEVAKLAQMIFNLGEDTVREVEAVLVDGQEIPKSDYLKVRNKIRIHSKYFLESREYNVEIKYKYEETKKKMK